MSERPTHVGQVTASHDLKQLQTSGLLAGRGDGRSRSYVGTPALLRRVVELFTLPVDVSGDGPADSDLPNAVIAELAAKVHGQT